MKVTTTQLLDFFAKVERVSSSWRVRKIDVGYEVIVDYAWTGNRFYPESFVITDEGVSTLEYGRDHDFEGMDWLMDKFLKEEEEREIEERKRQEVLSRLTAEEKKLLGLSS